MNSKEMSLKNLKSAIMIFAFKNCNLEMTIDYQKSTLVCMKCGLCEYYPVYVVSYNHTMQPLRRKCSCKRSDNFKVILNQFFYGAKKLVPDDVMEAIGNEIHDETTQFYRIKGEGGSGRSPPTDNF